MTLTVAVPRARARDDVPYKPVRSMLVAPAGAFLNHDRSRKRAMLEPVSRSTSSSRNRELAAAMLMGGLVVEVVGCPSCVGELGAGCGSTALCGTATMATQVPPSVWALAFEALGELSTSLLVLTVAMGCRLDPIS